MYVILVVDASTGSGITQHKVSEKVLISQSIYPPARNNL